jgi:hypothetical protein
MSGGPRPALISPGGQQGTQALASAFIQVGAERERQAAIQQDNFDRLENEQRKARNIERVTAARLEWTQTFQNRQTEAGPAADGFTGSLLKDFKGWSETSAAAISDEREREMFKGMIAPLGDHLGQSGISFEGQQRRAWRRSTLADGIDTDAKTAGADPSQVLEIVAARRAAIRQSGDLLPDEQMALEVKARESIAFNAGATLVTRDPAGWLKRDAKTDPLISLLDPANLRALNGHAQALVSQQRNEAERNGERAIKDAEKAVEGLREFALGGGLPDLAYQAQVRTLTRGTPYAEAADALLGQAQVGAAFGSQSLPKQAAALQQMGMGGNPDEKKLIDFARQVHDTQRRAFDDNPWAAATRFHRLPAVPEAQITDAGQALQLIQQRRPMMSAVEASAGKPVSPLQPGEATQWADRLKALPVEQRADQLATVGQALGIGQVAALADQLDKGNKPLALAMKLGLDRTSAGRTVAGLALRGAQALADKTVKKDDQALTGWRSEIAGMVRGTLGDETAEQDIIEAAYYVRAAMDVEGIEVPGYSLKASNENAVRMVIGTPLERGGVKMLTPRGMDERTFDERSRAALQPLAGQKLYIRGKEMTAEELAVRITGYGMRRDGQGRYTPVLNGAYITTDKDGQQPLRLEVR